MITTPNGEYDLCSMTRNQIQFGSLRTVSTPVKIAAFAFGLVLLIPILALLVIAGVVSCVVFGVLLLVGVVNTKVRSLTGKDNEGRKNVRVRR